MQETFQLHAQKGNVLRIRKWQAPLERQLEERRVCHLDEEINTFKQEEKYARQFGGILEKEIGKKRMNLGVSDLYIIASVAHIYRFCTSPAAKPIRSRAFSFSLQ
jgi:hypothetical protein